MSLRFSFLFFFLRLSFSTFFCLSQFFSTPLSLSPSLSPTPPAETQSLGLRGQEGSKKQGRRPLRREQLLGPDPRRRLVVDRPRVLRRLRPLHARVPKRPLQRHSVAGESPGGEPKRGGFHGGADPGEGEEEKERRGREREEKKGKREENSLGSSERARAPPKRREEKFSPPLSKQKHTPPPLQTTTRARPASSSRTRATSQLRTLF